MAVFTGLAMSEPRGLAHGLFCVGCGAKPGARCLTISGRRRYRPHVERIDLAIGLSRGELDAPTAAGLWRQIASSGMYEGAELIADRIERGDA